MQNEYFEQLTNTGKTSFETFQALGTINSKVMQKLAELQLNFASLNIESGIEQAKLLTSTTNYKDLLSAESDFADEYSNKALSIARQAAGILTQSRDEIIAWFEKGVETANKSAASSVKRINKKASESD